MNKAILAAAAALAAVAVTPAHAAVSINCPQISGSASCSFSESNGTGIFGSSVKGAFNDTFYITLTSAYNLSITLTNTLDVGGPISFSLHQLLNSAPVSLGLIEGSGVANNFFVGPGVYALHFTGTSNTKASYSGTIDVAAVPEPASWAMMIAGIAAVGVAMRRRAQTARVAFS